MTRYGVSNRALLLHTGLPGLNQWVFHQSQLLAVTDIYEPQHWGMWDVEPEVSWSINTVIKGFVPCRMQTHITTTDWNRYCILPMTIVPFPHQLTLLTDYNNHLAQNHLDKCILIQPLQQIHCLFPLVANNRLLTPQKYFLSKWTIFFFWSPQESVTFTKEAI